MRPWLLLLASLALAGGIAAADPANSRAILRIDALVSARKFEAARAMTELEIARVSPGKRRDELRMQLADVHFHWAQALRHEGRQLEAIGHFQKAYRIDSVLSRAWAATELYNIGVAYSELHRPDLALKYLRLSLPIQRESHNANGEWMTLRTIGVVYYRQARYPEALKYFELALPIQHHAKNRAREAATLRDIGTAHSALGHASQAAEYYRLALAIHRQIGDREGEAATIAAMHAAQGGTWL